MNTLESLALNPPVGASGLKDVVARLSQAKFHLLAVAAILLAAAIYLIGYPVVITLGLFGTFTGLTMAVVLTAIDAFAKPVARPKARRAR